MRPSTLNSMVCTRVRPRTVPQSSAIGRVSFPVLGDLGLVFIPDRQQHLLRVVQVAPLFPVVLKYAGFDDGVDRTGLLAKAAENALGQVNVIAASPPRPILALIGFNGDRQGRDRKSTRLNSSHH